MTTDKHRRAFISYSRTNKEFATKLTKGLRSAGFPVWFDQLDIPTGARWDDEVEKALRECSIFMVILTPASIASENVKDEIGYAIDHGKRILPVLLEDCDVPLRLRRFQHVDFTAKSFEEGFESAKELLSDLIDQASMPAPVGVKTAVVEALIESTPEPVKEKPAPEMPVKKTEVISSAEPAQKKPVSKGLVIGIVALVVIVIGVIGFIVLLASGNHIKSVTFGDGSGNVLGTYVETGPGTWEERGLEGAVFNYEETKRENSSIYLFDSGRGVTIQLDLNAKVVNYDDGTSKIAPLYFITEVK